MLLRLLVVHGVSRSILAAPGVHSAQIPPGREPSLFRFRCHCVDMNRPSAGTIDRLVATEGGASLPSTSPRSLWGLILLLRLWLKPPKNQLTLSEGDAPALLVCCPTMSVKVALHTCPLHELIDCGHDADLRPCLEGQCGGVTSPLSALNSAELLGPMK